MISQISQIKCSFLTLFLFFKLNAQDVYNKQIDEMLFDARKTLITDPERTVALSKDIYRLSSRKKYKLGEDYAFLLRLHGYDISRQYDSTLLEYENLEAAARRHSNYEVLADGTLIKAKALSKLHHYDLCQLEIERTADFIKKIASTNSKNIYQGLKYQTLAGLALNQFKSRDTVFYYNLLAKKEFEKVVDQKSRRFLMYPKNDLLFYNYAYLGNEFMFQSKVDSVDFYLSKALDLKLRYRNNICEVLIYNNIGYSFMLKNDFERALKNYKISISIAENHKSVESLASAYEGISVVYEKMGDFKNATKYLTLTNSLRQTSKIADQNAESVPVDIINKNADNDVVYWIILLSLITIIACIYFAFALNSRSRTEELTKIQIEKLLNAKMTQIEINPQEIRVQEGKYSLEEIVKLAIANEPTFYIKFQETFPCFIASLLQISPTLVASELKFSAYIKLDFSTKEIARYSNLSVRAVEAKKYRLRKKLFIPTESDTNIWMSNV